MLFIRERKVSYYADERLIYYYLHLITVWCDNVKISALALKVFLNP